jgi:hypothetical protein
LPAGRRERDDGESRTEYCALPESHGRELDKVCTSVRYRRRPTRRLYCRFSTK